jgi:hypothetical protein
MKTLARNHVTCSLCGLSYATIELDFCAWSVRRHSKGRGLFNAGQFGIRARHSTTLQCMWLMDYVTLNFNNKMSMAAVFLDIEKVFDTT